MEVGLFHYAFVSLSLIFTARCTLVQSAVLPWHVVCLSVCPSVTLVNCDHICWNSSKIISPLVSLIRYDIRYDSRD